jgi:hypothetical protein
MLIAQLEPHLINVKPWGTSCGKTYAYIITISATMEPSAMENQKTKRKMIHWLTT